MFLLQGPWGGCCPSILASPTSAPGRRDWEAALWISGGAFCGWHPAGS